MDRNIILELVKEYYKENFKNDKYSGKFLFLYAIKKQNKPIKSHLL